MTELSQEPFVCLLEVGARTDTQIRKRKLTYTNTHEHGRTHAHLILGVFIACLPQHDRGEAESGRHFIVLIAFFNI
jgi:hypothetical protein